MTISNNMKQKFRFISIAFLIVLLNSCVKKKEIEGIVIETTLYENQSYQSNKELCGLITKTLDKDENALSKLIDFWCGGGAGCYDLGFIVTQIIYKMGEDEFLLMAQKLNTGQFDDLVDLIEVGLEYGYVGDKRIDDEFPKLFAFFNDNRTEITYQGECIIHDYKLSIKPYDNSSSDKGELNALFVLAKNLGGTYSEIFKDTVHNEVDEIKLSDYNNDGIADILIQNFSDVRSNWTYYLYLTDIPNQKLTKIRGFEEIKNPRYLPRYGLIDNYVNSGRNWTQFHKIQGDSVITYGITIYDGEDENGQLRYDSNYKDAIRQILNDNSTNR
jgi:hypothetical protein